MKKKLLLFYSFLVFLNRIYTTNQKEEINYDYVLKGFLTEVNEPILEELTVARPEEEVMLIQFFNLFTIRNSTNERGTFDVIEEVPQISQPQISPLVQERDSRTSFVSDYFNINYADLIDD